MNLNLDEKTAIGTGAARGIRLGQRTSTDR